MFNLACKDDSECQWFQHCKNKKCETKNAPNTKPNKISTATTITEPANSETTTKPVELEIPATFTEHGGYTTITTATATTDSPAHETTTEVAELDSPTPITEEDE